MKCICYICILLPCFSFCQNRTNIWELGWNAPQYNFGIEFNSGSADTFSVTRWLRMLTTNTSICDTSGSILFYTNGKYLANKNNDTLYHSIGFNPGAETSFATYGLSLPSGIVIIPLPNHDTQYYIFHESSEPINTDSGVYYQPLNLSYSIIDMTLDNGLGGIIDSYKNIHLIDDTLNYGRIAACKHANGRDWWLFVHEYNTDRFYSFLITPDSIHGPFQQVIGSKTELINNQFGAGIFSPDGSQYAMIGLWGIMQVFDFNRCTGKLSNPRQTTPPDLFESTLCCAFSPNSRFLYVTRRFDIYQYDTWANNLDQSRIKVADWDTFNSPFPTLFYNMQLAPDNNIYICTYGSSNIFHYIDKPDEQGISCNVIQNNFVLPQINAYSTPTYPNYDLGRLIGSPCDTLFISATAVNKEDFSFAISPNPASNQVNIVYSITETSLLSFTDLYGKTVKSIVLYPWFKNRVIYLNELPKGIYFATLIEGKKETSKKMILE